MLYSLYPQPRSFAVDEYLHHRSGYVIDTPMAFLMGRPVNREAPEELIRDPAIKFSRRDADGWLIWIFTGDITMMLHLAPYPLPYVGWSRRNGPIKWYESEGFKERIRRREKIRENAFVGGELREGIW